MKVSTAKVQLEKRKKEYVVTPGTRCPGSIKKK